MNERQRKIVRLLSGYQNEYVSSEVLAEKLGVTSRTIKSDIPSVNEELQQYHSRVISKRNHGYRLEVDDLTSLQAFIMVKDLSTPAATRKIYDDPELGLYIARRLLGADSGVTIENLCEELAYSRSALTELIKWSTNFLESYRIKVRNKSNSGLVLVGEERFLRMAMVEMVGFHYHKTYMVNTYKEKFRWLVCDQNRRADIRHTLLRILRESKFSLRDSMTQRIAAYLVVAYNRFMAGYRLSLPENFRVYCTNQKVLKLVRNLFEALGTSYAPLLEDEDEILFLAAYIISNLDIRERIQDEELRLPIQDRLNIITHQVTLFLNRINLTLDEKEQGCLESILADLIYSHYFEFDGYEKFDYAHELKFISSAIALYFSYNVAQIMNNVIEFRSCRTDLSLLSTFILMVLSRCDYPVKPLKLLATHSFGPALGQPLAEKLKSHFSKQIESIRYIELYEYRALEKEGYDGMLLDLDGNDGSSNGNGYNYDLPYVETSVYNEDFEMLKIHNDFLIAAYQYQDYLPDASLIHIYKDFTYANQQQMIQFLAYSHGKDLTSINYIENNISLITSMKSPVFNRTAIIYIDPDYCREETFEYYQLKNTGNWKSHRIDAVIFFSVRYKTPLHVKAMETILRSVSIKTNNAQFFMTDATSAMEHILRESLRIK